jgi:hypothetical protein
MKFENQVFWQIGLIAPDNPTDSGGYEAILMSRCVDGMDPRELEIPI